MSGVTYQAQLLANSIQYDKIRRGGSDGRKLYNGGTLEIDGAEFHFTGGMQPREYTVRNPKRKMEIWNIQDGYEIGESTSPNVILFRITWQYYMTLINKYKKVTVQFLPVTMQKSIKNCLRQWDFCTLESLSHGLCSKCTALLNSYTKSIF